MSATRQNDELLSLFHAYGWTVQHFMVRSQENTQANFKAGKPIQYADTPQGPVDLGDGIASFLNTRRVLGCE